MARGCPRCIRFRGAACCRSRRPRFSTGAVRGERRGAAGAGAFAEAGLLQSLPRIGARGARARAAIGARPSPSFAIWRRPCGGECRSSSGGASCGICKRIGTCTGTGCRRSWSARIEALRHSGRKLQRERRPHPECRAPPSRRLRVAWRPRGSARSAMLSVDLVVNATGPN